MVRGCPLSMEDESCHGWYPGDTQEGVTEDRASARAEGRGILPPQIGLI